MPFRHTFKIVKFNWDPEKNKWLKKERHIFFEELAILLGNGSLWNIMEHPQKENYPNQEIFLIPINNYIYFVPFVMDGDTFFLKTAFPSRKATRDYLKEKGIKDE